MPTSNSIELPMKHPFSTECVVSCMCRDLKGTYLFSTSLRHNHIMGLPGITKPYISRQTKQSSWNNMRGTCPPPTISCISRVGDGKKTTEKLLWRNGKNKLWKKRLRCQSSASILRRKKQQQQITKQILGVPRVVRFQRWRWMFWSSLFCTSAFVGLNFESAFLRSATGFPRQGACHPLYIRYIEAQVKWEERERKHKGATKNMRDTKKHEIWCKTARSLSHQEKCLQDYWVLYWWNVNTSPRNW